MYYTGELIIEMQETAEKGCVGSQQNHVVIERRIDGYRVDLLMVVVQCRYVGQAEAGFYVLHVSKEIMFHSFKAIVLFHNHPKSDEIFLFHFSVKYIFLKNPLAASQGT